MALHVDADRLMARLHELATHCASGRAGVTRLAWSPEDVAGRALATAWMRQAGLDASVDAATNLIGATAGAGPAIVTGSHLDTVVDGGPLDGAYGVVAAIEAATTVAERGITLRHPLRIVAFANEEGAGGTPGMFGSKAIAGNLADDVLDGVDDDGRPITELIRDAGGDPDRLASAAWATGSMAAFVELHIEQGPVLASSGTTIGVVDGITGQRQLDIVVDGAANHAGTTPMDLRQDALAAAAEVILAIESIAVQGVLRVATCGHARITPNVRNVVPGQVILGADMRDGDDERIEDAIDVVNDRLAGIARRRGLTITTHRHHQVPAAPTDERLRVLIGEAAAALGFTATTMPSGAGHDAQVMARLGPVAMVFVPSAGGLSHAPGEHTERGDLVAGADVLLNALVAADAELPR